MRDQIDAQQIVPSYTIIEWVDRMKLVQSGLTIELEEKVPRRELQLATIKRFAHEAHYALSAESARMRLHVTIVEKSINNFVSMRENWFEVIDAELEEVYDHSQNTTRG